MKLGKPIFIPIILIILFNVLLSVFSQENSDVGKIIVVLSVTVLLLIIVLIYFKLQGKKLKNRETKLAEDLDIVYSGSATYVNGIPGIGGRLILTTDEIIFLSHKLNSIKDRLAIPLKDIKSVKPINSLIIVPTKFIIFEDLNSYIFIVNKRKVWIDQMNKMIKNKF